VYRVEVVAVEAAVWVSPTSVVSENMVVVLNAMALSNVAAVPNPCWGVIMSTRRASLRYICAYPNSSRLDGVCNSMSLSGILSKNRAGKPIEGVVRHLNDL
jgi:hypothetical protein